MAPNHRLSMTSQPGHRHLSHAQVHVLLVAQRKEETAQTQTQIQTQPRTQAQAQAQARSTHTHTWALTHAFREAYAQYTQEEGGNTYSNTYTLIHTHATTQVSTVTHTGTLPSTYPPRQGARTKQTHLRTYLPRLCVSTMNTLQ